MGKLTGKNMLSSIKLASAKNARYMPKHVKPIFQSSLNLFSANATYKPIRVERSDIAEYVMPLEFSEICWTIKQKNITKNF